MYFNKFGIEFWTINTNKQYFSRGFILILFKKKYIHVNYTRYPNEKGKWFYYIGKH